MTRPTSCDTETCHEVIGNCPSSSLPLKRSPIRGNEAIDGNTDNECDVEPVDVLVPVGLGDGLLGDVRFLRIVPLVSVGF